MASNYSTVKIYKRERTLLERVLGSYENGKTKTITLKQWSKKCGLQVGQMSGAGDKFIYESGIDLPFDEMEALANALPKMSKANLSINYAELGEHKDLYNNEYRTILKSSEYGGLKVCRLKKTSPPVDFAPDDANDIVDPEPSTNPKSAQVNDCWSECFDKFYINKNDDWKKISTIIRDFCCETYNLLNASSSSDVIPPTPPATPSEQKQLEPPKKRKYTNTKGSSSGEIKKKKGKIQFDEETTSEVSRSFPTVEQVRSATGVLLSFMCKYKKSCEETIAQFRYDMNKQFPFCYEQFLLASDHFETTCTKLNE
ncbi:Hypothetical predicted protein [Paramuricea clavata]|uniref:Uncharacterized protein n=1 Tax=Paramuricea clavata TaxID=317549 RepID=A0A6S7FRM7_PARCT|nr:Hypothetical predicted protein [Paramuricea clavata]